MSSLINLKLTFCARNLVGTVSQIHPLFVKIVAAFVNLNVWHSVVLSSVEWVEQQKFSTLKDLLCVVIIMH